MTIRYATGGVLSASIQYKYDSMGNIIETLENGRSVCRYEYDSLNRLVREDNVPFGKTATWSYDNNGNIMARYEYAITAKPTSELHLLDCTCKLYSYADNSDQLVSFNGESFVYDIIGNPTIYRGKTATWTYGRELAAYDGNTFSYDARGRRIAKNSIAFTYDSNGNLIKQSNGLEFLYDHTGLFAVKYNNSTYYYRKNAQNDIIALLDNQGRVVVKYDYDAWGKCQTTVVDPNASTIAELNPFRYRSYYFDTETGFYFLKTRYYDPEIGRFITIDDISYLDPDTINGLNLYAYCGNNPVMGCDPNGTWNWNNFWKVVGAIGVVFAVTAVTIATAGIATIALGASTAAVAAVITGATIGGIVAGGVEVGMQIVQNGIDGMNLGAIAIETFTGAAYGAISGLSGMTTSAGLRIGLRGARVALSATGTLLHGINNGDSATVIATNVKNSILTGVLIQSVFLGLDVYTGKTSSNVLCSLKLDGKLSFENNEILMLIGVLAAKGVWKNKNAFLSRIDYFQ